MKTGQRVIFRENEKAQLGTVVCWNMTVYGASAIVETDDGRFVLVGISELFVATES